LFAGAGFGGADLLDRLIARGSQFPLIRFGLLGSRVSSKRAV
jgi:hypothetical protein